MTQHERLIFLIQALLAEREEYAGTAIPSDYGEQKRLLRGLMNVRPPQPITPEFLQIQDEYLQAEIASKGITELESLHEVQKGIYLWKGDIITLRVDAIVNAANSGMTGCYYPCHGCIDNAIHSFAGVQLRLECAELMKRQGHDEPTGSAKITKAYNLPCDYVIHTVGPIVGQQPTPKDREMLISCYRACMDLARQNHLQSIAFCCISTGEFHYPNREAAEIAVRTVQDYKEKMGYSAKVIFNVFKDIDEKIYESILFHCGKGNRKNEKERFSDWKIIF